MKVESNSFDHRYGCCKDEKTEATGEDGEGCPEKTTTEGKVNFEMNLIFTNCL